MGQPAPWITISHACHFALTHSYYDWQMTLSQWCKLCCWPFLTVSHSVSGSMDTLWHHFRYYCHTAPMTVSVQNCLWYLLTSAPNFGTTREFREKTQNGSTAPRQEWAMWPVPGGHAAPPKMRLVCKLSHKNKTVDTEKYYQNTSNVQYSLYTKYL